MADQLAWSEDGIRVESTARLLWEEMGVRVESGTAQQGGDVVEGIKGSALRSSVLFPRAFGQGNVI